jgi:hypothetical protein
MSARRAPPPVSQSAPIEPVDPVDLAKSTLQAICRDLEAPAGARAQAARTLLELAGALKNVPQTSANQHADLSEDEINARLAALDTPDTV